MSELNDLQIIESLRKSNADLLDTLKAVLDAEGRTLLDNGAILSTEIRAEITAAIAAFCDVEVP